MSATIIGRLSPQELDRAAKAARRQKAAEARVRARWAAERRWREGCRQESPFATLAPTA